MNTFERGYLMGRIDQQCPGWSRLKHFLFFEAALDRKIETICMLGVYHGRDIAYLQALLAAKQKRALITGVDLFSDQPGTDWPEENRWMTWEQAGYGKAPTVAIARTNLEALGAAGGVDLVQSSAQDFLRKERMRYDFIYVDIAHDYETTREVLELALPRLNQGGLLAGDDYTNDGTFGVRRAVDEKFGDKVQVITDDIWMVET